MNPLLVPLLGQVIGTLLSSGGAASAPLSQTSASQPTAPAGVDFAGLAAIIAATQRPPEPPVEVKLPRSAAVIATVVVFGFFAVLAALCWLLIIGHEPNPALYVGFGALLVLTTTVVCFMFGSSWGSRTKDARRPTEGQGGILPVPVPTPQPGPEPQPTPTPAPSAPVLTIKGKCSWFGGPDDPESKKTPDLAFWNEAQARTRPDLFTSVGSGLFGRLNPQALYIACRWDYKQTPAAWLRQIKVKVSANGKSVEATPVDWGPHVNTGRVADLSPGVMKELGLDTDDQVTVEVPVPIGAPVSAPSPSRPTGADIVALARPHIGERYENVLVPKNDPNWKGPWDCAEFASWLVYQAAGILYGCTNDSEDPAKADAYTGAWKTDAAKKGQRVSVEEAAATPGAFLLRYPPAPGEMGHIAVSDGHGGTIEAASKSTGVVAGKVSGRRWDTGVLVPGIDYTGGAAQSVQPPAKIYAIGQPNMSAPKVTEIQVSLEGNGFSPGDIDGEYGQNTALAVVAFQKARGLIPDGEVGPDTAKALGITL